MKIIYQEVYEDDDVDGHDNQHEGGIIIQMGDYVYSISHYYGNEYIQRQPAHSFHNEGGNFEQANWISDKDKRIDFKFLNRKLI
jgi:hypothetical protein